MKVGDVLKDSAGSKVVSVILGLGLAAMFRKVCKGEKCIVVKGPGEDAVSSFYYKLEDDCYKYTPYAVDCAKGEKKAEISNQVT